MTDEQFAVYLALVHERSGVECKGPGLRSDTQLFAKVTRAVLSMANRRDGGLVILGVDDSNGTLTPVGLSETELESWQQYDHVADALATYADPAISFDLEVHEHQGRKFVVLVVHEFEDVPVLCKKGYGDGRAMVLRPGACYVRTRRKPETAEIPTQTEMRDLIDLATEKRLQRFIAQARAAGLGPLETPQPPEQESFEQQVMEMNCALLTKIRARGYWQTVVRPGRFARKAIPSMVTLHSLLEKAAVSMRGWDFPHLGMNQALRTDLDWIGQEVEAERFLESWRFYQSGLFVDVSGIEGDWLDQSEWLRPQPDWAPGKFLSVEEAIYRLSEIYEFAARLAAAEEYPREREMRIDVLLTGLQGRVLYFQRPGRWPLRREYRAEVEEFPAINVLLRDDLIARPRVLALKVAAELFERFGWEASEASLRTIQAGMGK
jgi:hypothetical protein